MSGVELARIRYLEAEYLEDFDLWVIVPFNIIFKTGENDKPAR
jgi:hypothetical protein